MDTNGTDSGDCTVNNCATLNYTISQAEEGDTIFIYPGTFDLANESGNQVNISKPLTVTAYDRQDIPILQGLRTENGCVRISANNVTLSYVKVYHGTERTGFSSWASAIRIDGEHVTVDHCEARFSCHGIDIRNRRNITISNSKCYENGQYFEGAANGNGHGIVHNTNGGTMATSWAEKIYLYNNDCYDNWGDGFQCGHANLSAYVEIDGGNYYGNWEDGFDFKEFDHYRVHGVRVYDNYADGIKCNNNDGASQGSIDIYNNQIFRNGYTGIMDGDPDDAPIVRIFNNLIYDNAECRDGTCADYGPDGDYDRWGTYDIILKVAETEVFGNIIYSNGATDGDADHGAIQCDNNVGILKNNIIFNNGGSAEDNFDTSVGEEDHNYIYPNAGLSGLDPTDVLNASDPGFLDPERIDFRISDLSPCRGAGVYDSDYPTDFAGNDRISDIGAYVYGSATTGLEPSGTGSAIVGSSNWDPSSIDVDILNLVRTKKIMFSHMSTGGHIIGGMEALADDEPPRYSLNFANEPDVLQAGELYHWYSGLNNEPAGKINDFDDKLRSNEAGGTPFGQEADIAFMKFCYTDLETGDIENDTDVTDLDNDGDKDADDVFLRYLQVYEALAQSFPDCRFVHMTSPLTTEYAQPWMVANARSRHTFNEQLRSYINTNGGYLLDLADIEAHDDAGSPITFTDGDDTLPMLWTGWAEDRGHLNAAGVERAALAMWKFLALVVQGGQDPIDPNNSAPEGTITAPTGTTTISVGQSVTFTATSHDADGDTPLTYAWNFGSAADVLTAEVQNPGQITFNSVGTYTITFTVTDAKGLSDPTPATVTVIVEAESGNDIPGGSSGDSGGSGGCFLKGLYD